MYAERAGGRAVVDSARPLTAVDGVGGVQLCGGLGLGLEPLQLPRVQRGGERQHLERDAAVQRDLLGLVDDAHAAAAELAEDAEVAEPAMISLPSPQRGEGRGWS